MGHSVARIPSQSARATKVQKRLELLPEEALYLVERGAMLCWKACDLPVPHSSGLEDVEGVPMTVQQAFAEMIGKEDLTLEKYQVFAYLKRLGYAVVRSKPPSPDYPMPSSLGTNIKRSNSLWARIWSSTWFAISRLSQFFTPELDWWKPLRFSRWLHHNMDSRVSPNIVYVD